MPSEPPFTPSRSSTLTRWIGELTLQQKAWCVMLVALAFFAVALGIGIQGTFSRSFHELEMQTVSKSAERLQRSIELFGERIEKNNRDYANWDDTYDFVDNPNQSYIDTNFGQSVFSNLELSGMLIFHRGGRLVAGKTCAEDHVPVDVDPATWTDLFGPYVAKASLTESSSVRGLIRTPQGLALFSCLPILRNDATGDPRGAMVMLSNVDANFIQKLRALTVLDLSIRILDPNTESDLERRLRSHRDSIPLHETTEEQLTYHLLLRDVSDHPVLIISCTLKRDIHRQARNTTWLSFLAIFSIGLFCTAMVIWIVRVQVIRPLEALHAAVNRIGRLGDSSVRVNVKGVDEIASLGTEINHMLDALAQAERDQEHSKKERDHLQAQLMQAQKMEAIGTLAGGLAHDFNNMLNSILGSTELLRFDLPQGHPAQEHVQRIERAGTNASLLVRQLLTVSRKQSMKIQPVRMAELVQETIRLLRAGLPKTISFQFENLSDQDTVMGDPAQLHQVIMNLATNSAHAMAGRERGLFRITLELVHLPAASRPETLELLPGKYLRISCSDNGCGIQKDVLSRIFEPFFTTKPLGSGTGLGLAMVHGIISKHNGCIGVQSEEDVGTSFIIHLPILQTVPTQDKELPAPSGAVEPLPAGTKPVLLLVDDDKLVRDTLCGGLRRLGYEVIPTGNVREAASLVADTRQRIDWVVTDHLMPETSGLELGQQLRLLRPELNMILISGFADALSEETAMAKGFRRMLSKPVTPIQINETIRELDRQGS